MHTKIRIILLTIPLAIFLTALCTAIVSAQNPALTITESTHGITEPQAGTFTCYYMDQAPVSAIPDIGYELDYWLLNGKKIDGNQNPILLTMDHDQSLQAVFRTSTEQNPLSASTSLPENQANNPNTNPSKTPQDTIAQQLADKNSFPVPAAAAIIILSIMVLGLVYRTVKPTTK